ncbi:TIGR04141 family sporadically distributed protein [Streptomyces sp. TRM 70351]|uniref:TIGR04141 family sporadically distributed protein n=1 Tax=Streptomyces sp. TRM 70351 TaxID=3116552 RepID=UPI002E7C0D59|nr:TIGR04141 family sporadically distributed protein [Streptomyces sp. TRM 70351]MEE1927599.1 TIGR04141 family sporadically distributed protein [Streptomyces sp. TRM 70351]
MAPGTSATSKRTLYRLAGVAPTVDAMFDVLEPARLEAVDAELHFPEERLGVPALLVAGSFEQPVASWCGELTRTTGCEVSRPVNRSAGLLMLAVDGEVYAIGYDQGFRLVPDHVKDRRFGLSFVIRRVNPAQIRDMVSHTPGGGRTDITLVPGGAPVWSLGVQEHAQIVRRLGGRLDGLELTITQDDPTKISSVEGGTGLRMRLGIDAGALVSDIKAITRVLRDEAPAPELEFVEHIVPVKDAGLVTRLEEQLDDMLGEEPDGRIAAAVPSDHWDDYGTAQAFATKVHSLEARLTDDFSLEYVLDRARVQRAGTRFAALRDGTVTLYAHTRAEKGDVVWTSGLLRWIEAEVTLGARRFSLLDGQWYEIGEAYLEAIRSHVERLVTGSPSVDLPAWALGDKERDYNESVPDLRPGYACFDRDNVRTALHRGNGVEICDLLSPDNVLVMVKRAKGSDALSHLFGQAVVAVQTLLHSPEAVEEFARKVAAARPGQALPDGFRPSKVVFAILLKGGTELTADTLFPFSQVTLVQTARMLEAWGVAVEVIGIQATAVPASRTGIRHLAA